MKLFLLQSNPKLWHHHLYSYNHFNLSRALTALFSSAHTTTKPISPSSASSDDSLDRRILRSGDPTASIVPVLQKWLDEGGDIKQFELRRFIKQLRAQRRLSHALQISQWMGEQSKYNVDSGDFAVHLDLTATACGLEQAEKYFQSIPDALKSFQVYGSLLNCYARYKSLEKAEVIFQKIKELGFIKGPLAYNLMMDLYSKLGNHEKLNALVHNMKEKGIYGDMFTYNIRLNAYAVSSNIEEMEKLLWKMEADPLVSMDWTAYVVMANGYMKAGLMEKTLKMLKKAEQLIRRNKRKEAYQTLLTLYAAIGKKDDVYRLWNCYKNSGMFFNAGYLSMISSLVKLDDMEGAQHIWEEWKSNKRYFEIKIPSLMIRAYAKKGLWEKAEACLQTIIESRREPNTGTWDALAIGYCLGGQMEKAIETIEKIISTSKAGWKPNNHTLAACFEYLNGKGNETAAEELLMKIRAHSSLPKDVCHSLEDHQTKKSAREALNQLQK